MPVTITRIELGEIKQKMLLSASEGEAADLVMPIPHAQLGELAQGGVLADMSSYATQDYLDDLSRPGAARVYLQRQNCSACPCTSKARL